MKIEIIVVFLEWVSLGKMQDAKVFLYQILRKPTKEKNGCCIDKRKVPNHNRSNVGMSVLNLKVDK